VKGTSQTETGADRVTGRSPVEAEEMDTTIGSTEAGESSEAIRARVDAARQRERFRRAQI
jgi:predicted ATPase with chaperone activity